LVQVQHFGHLVLNRKTKFKRLDQSFHLRIILLAGELGSIQILQQIELASLRGLAEQWL
jgi:hypothetical protein